MAIETCSSTAKSDQKFTFHPSVSTSQRIIGHHVSETLMMTMTCEVSLLPPGKYLSRMSDLEEKKEFDLNNLRTKACIFNTKELDRALIAYRFLYEILLVAEINKDSEITHCDKVGYLNSWLVSSCAEQSLGCIQDKKCIKRSPRSGANISKRRN